MEKKIKYEEPKLVHLSNGERPVSRGIGTSGLCSTGTSADVQPPESPWLGAYNFNCVNGGDAMG